LQYPAEADFSTMLTAQFAPAVAQTLEQISPNIIQLEQYMDFVRNRLFRQTLLCHKNLKLNRALTPAVMEQAFNPDTYPRTSQYFFADRTQAGKKLLLRREG